ncbi:MAG: serine/threonine-protein phosphatase [Rhodospirillales bacterium]|nr:serine/threonine-protein phosphatase [Rhodospirillales bacterium]
MNESRPIPPGGSRTGQPFERFGHGIVVAVAIVAALGLTFLTYLQAVEQERNVLAQNERTVAKFAKSVDESLDVIMVTGNADIARAFADTMKTLPDIVDFRFFRQDGLEAFRDNTVIDAVNRRLGENRYDRRNERGLPPRVLAVDDPHLLGVLKTGEATTYYERSPEGSRLYTILWPIDEHPPCLRCHGEPTGIPGLIKMTFSLAALEADIAKARTSSIFIILLVIAAMIAVAWAMVRMQKRQLQADVEAYRKSLARELDETRALQQRLQEELLPSPAVLETLDADLGLAIGGQVEMAETIGGDLWGVQPLGAHRVALFAVDFSGHGAQVAHNAFRFQTLLRETANLHDDPGLLLTALNSHLVTILPRGQYAAMFYGVLDLASDTLVYAGCGYPAVLIGHRGGGPVAIHPVRGLPLGIKAGMTYSATRLAFPANSYLLVHSDGAIECARIDGRRMDSPDIAALLAACMERHGTPAAFMDCLEPYLVRPLADDLTLVWATRAKKVRIDD